MTSRQCSCACENSIGTPAGDGNCASPDSHESQVTDVARVVSGARVGFASGTIDGTVEASPGSFVRSALGEVAALPGCAKVTSPVPWLRGDEGGRLPAIGQD